MENCLDGLKFVIIGVLESIEREEAADLIQRYGGKVTQSESKKTSYVLWDGIMESINFLRYIVIHRSKKEIKTET